MRGFIVVHDRERVLICRFVFVAFTHEERPIWLAVHCLLPPLLYFIVNVIIILQLFSCVCVCFPSVVGFCRYKFLVSEVNLEGIVTFFLDVEHGFT